MEQITKIKENVRNTKSGYKWAGTEITFNHTITHWFPASRGGINFDDTNKVVKYYIDETRQWETKTYAELGLK